MGGMEDIGRGKQPSRPSRGRRLSGGGPMSAAPGLLQRKLSWNPISPIANPCSIRYPFNRNREPLGHIKRHPIRRHAGRVLREEHEERRGKTSGPKRIR